MGLWRLRLAQPSGKDYKIFKQPLFLYESLYMKYQYRFGSYHLIESTKSLSLDEINVVTTLYIANSVFNYLLSKYVVSLSTRVYNSFIRMYDVINFTMMKTFGMDQQYPRLHWLSLLTVITTIMLYLVSWAWLVFSELIWSDSFLHKSYSLNGIGINI